MELEQKHDTQKLTEAGKPNLTGIPLQMKHSFEQSSGLSFDDVRVHYHSALPARLGALAYTQGTHVYMGPGQEQHLGHELGHVVQQKQGRVQATSVLGGVKINTSPAMEREADMLSRQAARGAAVQMRQAPSSQVIQMVQYSDINTMWTRICGNAGTATRTMIQQVVAEDPVLAELYNDAAQQVTSCDFQPMTGNSWAHVTLNPQNRNLPYVIFHRAWPNNTKDQRTFIRAIIHELTHVAAREQYQRNIPNLAVYHGNTLKNGAWLNMNLPLAQAPISDQQNQSINEQYNQLLLNIQYLHSVVNQDSTLPKEARKYLGKRLNYMEKNAPHHHYDTVLGDMMFYLQFEQLQDTPSYVLMQRMLREANDRRHQRRWFGNNLKPYDFTNVSCYSWY